MMPRFALIPLHRPVYRGLGILNTDFDSANIDGIRKINVIDWLLGSRHN